jgi:ElaB/YqjD/DUF883 family membrane-anchored ribosome-binding protein
MAKKIDEMIGSIREGVSGVAEKATDTAGAVADKIEDALEDASVEGKKIARDVKKDLIRRWKVVDQAGRENAFIMAVGALGVGILIGYLLSRDRKG